MLGGERRVRREQGSFEGDGRLPRGHFHRRYCTGRRQTGFYVLRAPWRLSQRCRPVPYSGRRFFSNRERAYRIIPPSHRPNPTSALKVSSFSLRGSGRPSGKTDILSRSDSSKTQGLLELPQPGESIFLFHSSLFPVRV